MASRYSAYALGLEKYVRDTWCEENCPADLDLKANPIMWLGLKSAHSGKRGLTPQRLNTWREAAREAPEPSGFMNCRGS